MVREESLFISPGGLERGGRVVISGAGGHRDSKYAGHNQRHH